MKFQSTRFGELNVADDNILSFPYGLPGFPEEKKFALLPHGSDSPFYFLQSTVNPDLTFILVEPFSFFADYTFKLNDEAVEYLTLSEQNPPQILNIVTMKESLDTATANLLAPVIINRKTRLAIQIVLEKTDYSTRHRLFPNGLPKQAAEGGK